MARSGDCPSATGTELTTGLGWSNRGLFGVCASVSRSFPDLSRARFEARDCRRKKSPRWTGGFGVGDSDFALVRVAPWSPKARDQGHPLSYSSRTHFHTLRTHVLPLRAARRCRGGCRRVFL